MISVNRQIVRPAEISPVNQPTGVVTFNASVT